MTEEQVDKMTKPAGGIPAAPTPGGEAAQAHLPGLDLRFGSNAVRLGLRLWLLAGLVVAAAMVLAPRVWERIEPLEDAPDYRVPYDLSYDYWLYQRWSGRSAGRGDALVVGDSVVWGPYVLRDETLSHCLSQRCGGRRFANLGLNGTYPAALAGLIEYYGGDIANRDVVLHCNLLWMSSPQLDLQEERAAGFNHLALVPQFYPRIPGYDETLSRRIGNVLDRHVPLFAWGNHMRVSRLGGRDLPAWSLDHPYDNPARALQPDAPPEPDKRQNPPLPWTDRSRGIGMQSPDWVPLERSIQWRFFLRTVTTLRERGNRVVVVMGPFNEHLLEEPGLSAYRRLRDQAVTQLRGQGVACVVPPTLPSELYGDSNHPLAGGYARLADWLAGQGEFKSLVTP